MEENVERCWYKYMKKLNNNEERNAKGETIGKKNK